MNARKGRRPRRVVSRFIPRLEALENRTCPASIQMVGETLYIYGDARNNQVEIRDLGDGRVQASVDSPIGTAAVRSGVHSIVVLTGKGNDTVNYSLQGDLVTRQAISVGTGQGSGRLAVNFDTTGGTILNAWEAQITGAGGVDTVTATLGSVAGTGSVNIYAFLDGGADFADVVLAGNLTDRATMQINLDGYVGNDILVVRTDPDAATGIAADAQLSVGLVGRGGEDQLGLLFTGTVEGTLNLGIDGGVGDDLMGYVATFGPETTGTFNANLRGGPGRDQVFALTEEILPGGQLSELKPYLLFQVDGTDAVNAQTTITDPLGSPLPPGAPPYVPLGTGASIDFGATKRFDGVDLNHNETLVRDQG